MEFLKTHIEGLFLIESAKTFDTRGYFSETFNAFRFQNAFGPFSFNFHTEFYFKKKEIIGPIYNSGTTLIKINYGEVFVSVIDQRNDSPTNNSWFGHYSTDIFKTTVVTKGDFTLGIQGISEECAITIISEFTIKKATESTILLDDSIGITWPL